MAKNRLRRLAGRMAAAYLRAVARSVKGTSEARDAGRFAFANHPAIIAVWHGQFLLVSAFRPAGLPVAAMVARHGDGDVIAQALSALDVGLVRGAGAGGRRKDRGGARALLACKKALDEGTSIVMTADVPPGPARRAGEGIITLARLTGRPIQPVAVATSRFATLDTWSRMTVNLPGGRVAAIAKPPIWVAADATPAAIEAARQAVERALDEATREAYAAIGRNADDVAPRSLATAPAAPGLGLRAYRAAMSVAGGTIAPLLLRYRVRRGKEDAARLAERYGRAGFSRPAGVLAWVHAASVGELNSILPLMGALRSVRPELTFLVTTGTVTSAEIARRRLSAHDIHQFVPLDTPGCVARFLDHWRPDLAVLTEQEIWPNLILDAHARAIPLALVNGRMSNRSYGRWKARKRMSRPLFSRFDVVLAQSEKLARRFGELGARRTIAAGNLKIDAPPPPIDQAALGALRAATDGRAMLVAASTHPGEEEMIAAAHRRLAADDPRFLTIIAPRHPERGSEIAAALTAQGFVVARRSTGEAPSERVGIYIADTIGELGTLYALSPVAFVGGSLVPHGGQNPIEAVRIGAAVVVGPHWFNFPEAVETLLAKRAAIEVADAEGLAVAVRSLTGDAAERAALRMRADQALASLSGALQRTVDALLPLLPVDRAGAAQQPAPAEGIATAATDDALALPRDAATVAISS